MTSGREIEKPLPVNERVGRSKGVTCNRDLILPAVCFSIPERVKAEVIPGSVRQPVSQDSLSIYGSGSDDAVWSMPLFQSALSSPW